MLLNNFSKSEIMEKYNFEDEATAWNEMQEIRNSFSPNLLNDIRVSSREDAVEKARNIVQRTLSEFGKHYDFSNIEPGHGPGHIMRDYMNAVILFSKLDANPKHILPGFVGGALHDIGCAVVPRYEEDKRVVRHAEAGSLLVKQLLDKDTSLNDAEKISIVYTMAAHTHYRTESKIECADGETRIIKPYLEFDKNNQPLWPVWFTRWIDRLDCNGPTFIGRHYLTLGEVHKDFDGKENFDVDFENHMKPSLRPFAEQVDENKKRNQTMSEHMKMFADSQSNESPYGEYDYGFMVELRNKSKERIDRIINSTQNAPRFFIDTEWDIRNSWKLFLSEKIEPSNLGNKTAKTLDKMFGKLDDKTRHAWCNAFLTTMNEYVGYSQEKLSMLSDKNDEVYAVPGITEDLRKVIDIRDKDLFAKYSHLFR